MNPNEFGAELNAHCQIIPGDKEWILLTDHDAHTFAPETYQVIHKAIASKPTTGVFGCMTNRIGYHEQCVSPVEAADVSQEEHYQRAINLAALYPNGETFDTLQVAGMFMLFKKSTWKAAGGFQKSLRGQSGFLFDADFCNRVRSTTKLPVRVIKGVYVFHYYRMHKNFLNTSHLGSY